MAVMASLLASQIWGHPARPEFKEMAIKVRRAFIARGYDNPAPKVDWIEKRVHMIDRWAKRFGIPDTVDEIVVLVIQETKLGMELDARYWGIGNISKGSFSDFEKNLHRVGWTEKLDKSSLDHQIAFTVSAYHLKLRIARGDRVKAIRLYNGAGPVAQDHLAKAKAWYKNIFGSEP